MLFRSPDGEQLVESGILMLSPADVPAPALEDVVTIDANAWAVKFISSSRAFVELQLERRTQNVIGGESKIGR